MFFYEELYRILTCLSENDHLQLFFINEFGKIIIQAGGKIFSAILSRGITCHCFMISVSSGTSPGGADSISYFTEADRQSPRHQGSDRFHAWKKSAYRPRRQ